MARPTLKIINNLGELVGIISGYRSLQWQRKLYGAGVFTLALHYSGNYVGALVKGNLIMLGDSSNKVGIIMSVEYRQSGNVEELEIKGYELKGILKQRLTIPTGGATHHVFSGIVGETIMKDLVQRACIDTVDEEIDNLNIITTSGRGASLDLKTRYQNLDLILEKVGRATGLGYTINYNKSTKNWDFDVIEQVDHTSTSLEPVIFGPKFNNVDNQVYTDSNFGKINALFVGGSGDGLARNFAQTGSGTNENRFTDFLDASDLSTTGDLEQRGIEYILKNNVEPTYDAVLTTSKTFQYETKWDIGSIVTLQSRFGNFDKIIEQVNEFYDSKGLRINICLGTPQKTLLDIVNNNNDIGVR